MAPKKERARDMSRDRPRNRNMPREGSRNLKENRCPPGKLMREGYTRRDGTQVDPSCVKNMGAPGRGEKLIPLSNKHMLSKSGYSDVVKMSTRDRHQALLRASKKESPVSVIRALTARANLTSRTNPQVSKIFKKDQEWLSKLYAKAKEKVKAKNIVSRNK